MSRPSLRIGFFLLLSWAIVFASCSPKPTRHSPIAEMPGIKLPNPKTIKSEDWRLFFQAEQAFAFKKYDQALELYQQAKQKSAKSRAHMVSSYRIGTIYYYREQYKAAATEFEYCYRSFPNSDLSFDVAYNWAAAEFQQENYQRAEAILSNLNATDIQRQGPERAEMVYRLAALSAAAMGNHSKATEFYARQIQLPLSESKRQTLREKVDGHLKQVDSRGDLEALLKNISEPITRSKIVERLDLLASAGRPVVPASPDVEQFETGTADVDPRKKHIGVILPLSGQWAAFGKRALNAILLGAQVYRDERKWDFHLFIRDSQSNPLTAQNAVDELVYKNKVFAIIGSTSWKESLAVARRAQQLGVVNMSLTVKEGLSARGPQLFQNGLTARVQMDNLVRHCIEEKKLHRFGILAPNDSFGKEMAEKFWDSVESFGGKVVAFELYPPDSTDFQSSVRSLVGLNQVEELRRGEWRELRKFIEEQKAQGVRNPKAEMPPVVDFDALFIPDTPKSIGQIAPSLAYFDVGGVTLLGTAEWNGAQLYQRAGKYVEGAIYPGTISTITRNPEQARFIQEFRQAYGDMPDLLSAQAFEAMEILAEGIRRTSSADYSRLSNELTQIRDFRSPLGIVSFDELRVAQRVLPIYSIGYGGRVTEQ